MEYNVDLRYPVCKKCKEGVLLPFFWKDMGVVYFCSNCGAKFTALAQEPTENGKPVFLDRPVYVDVPADEQPEMIKNTKEEEEADDDAEEDDIDEIFDIPETVPQKEEAVVEEVAPDLKIGWEMGDDVENPEEQSDTTTPPDVESVPPMAAVEEDGQDEPEEASVSEEASVKDKKKKKKKAKAEKEKDAEADAEDVPKDIEAYESILSKYIEGDK